MCEVLVNLEAQGRDQLLSGSVLGRERGEGCKHAYLVFWETPRSTRLTTFTTVSQFPSPVKEPQAERREEAEEGWAREKIGRTRRSGGYGRGWLGCGNVPGATMGDPTHDKGHVEEA